MNHIIKCLFTSFLIAAAMLLALPSAFAQTNSVRVLTDIGTGIGNFSIDGMEVRGAGLYWWKYGATGEIASYQPTLGIKAGVSKYSLTLDRSGPFYMIQGGNFIAGAERDGTYAYFTANRGGSQVGLFRQPLSSAVNAVPQRLVGIVAPEISTGAIGRSGRDLFFAPTYAGGYTAIWRASFDDAGDYTGAGVVAEGTLHQSSVRKLLFFNAVINGTNGRWGLCLQADATLWRFGPITASSLQPMVLLGGGVGDIGVRNEDGGIDVQIVRDEIYATTSPVNGGAVGKLVKINPTNGAFTTVFTDPNGQKFLAFGFDNNFLFISRTNGLPGELLRKYVPYRSAAFYYNPALETSTIPGNVQGWVNLENVSGTNLRSDGQWLYFTRGNDIRRVGTTVPPVTLDIQAFGIEAVQTVQDFNNSVPLVEGKPVLVRAYARLAANSTLANPTRQPSGILGVIRNNVGAGTYYPVAPTTISNLAASPLPPYRGSAVQSFNFVIPAEEVQRGTVSFVFNVNNGRSMIETGVTNPYGNNAAQTPVMQVVAAAAPTIICLPVQAQGSLYTLDTDPAAFWGEIARARALLPVTDIRVKTAAVTIARLVARYDPPRTVRRSFDFPDQQDDALSTLLLVAGLRGLLDGNVVGMIHPSIPGFNGLGYTPGPALLARMEPGTPVNGNVWDAPFGGRTLAHELGHNFGLLHINCGSPKNPDPNYPGNSCNINGAIALTNNNLATSIFGWDPLTGQVIDGTTVGDLLSYSASRWLSRYSRDKFLAGSGAQAPSSAALVIEGDVFLVTGSVRIAQAQASLGPAQLVPAGTYDPAAVAASLAKAAQQQGHDYVVRQLDAAGAVLGQSPVILQITGDGWQENVGFTQFISALPGAVLLQVAKNGTVLAQIAGTDAAPAVVGDAPIYDPDTQTLRWSWTATDADGDPLFSTVHFSANDGANWEVVEVLTGNSSLALDTRNLPGGAQCRLRVIVSDGFNTALTATDAFALPTHAPQITVIGATPRQQLPFAAKAALTAFAMDVEEGSLPGSQISWELSGPEPRTKSGDTLSLSGLPPGTYSAVASATDSAGEPGSKTVDFEVRPISIPVAAAPTLDGEADDPAYASAALVQWSSAFTGRISARLIRSGGRLYVGFSELPYRASGNPNAVVGLRVDVDGSADAAVQSSDLGFFVDEAGRPVQLEGNGLSMVTRADPAAGFETAVNSGEFAWTAEFCLPEAVLGGAEHGIRIMFTMDLPQADGGEQKFRWPATADANSPATWAPVQLGELPAPANAPPVAYAGGDRVLDPAEATLISLDGNGSRDPEGQPLTYQWTQVDGPTASLQGADTAQPYFTISPVAAPSTWRFQLVVNDGELDSAPAEVRVTALPIVLPEPPREVPRFTRYPDGTVEGYFTTSEPGLFDPASLGNEDTFGLGSHGLYSIETSEDLLTWTPRLELSPDLLGRLVFTDLSATELPQRFYRARLAGSEGLLAPGTALQFDGAPRSVQVFHSPALNSFPLTISAWINTTDTSTQVGGVVSKYADASGNGWSLFTYAGRVRGFYFVNFARYVWDGSLGLDGGFIADGQWHHIAMVIASSGGTLYVDGADRSNLNWLGTPAAPTATQPLQIGRYHNYPNSFTGQIDEVSIWSTALSGLQVLDLRRRGPAGTEANLEALWTLDEGTGTRATDSTANARHGTLLNSPLWVPSTAPIRR